MERALFPDLIVNGEAVPHATIAQEAQNHSAPSGKPGIAWRKAMDALAIRTLLLQEARRRGLAAKPAEVAAGRFETEEEALVRGLLDDAIDVTAPDEDAVRAEWLKDPSRFRTQPLWEVSHILCACDPTDETARNGALDRATVLTKLAKDNRKRFAGLASSESDCGSKANGGALGQLGPGDTVPEFEAALRELGEGEITAEPVLTRYGYHVIRLDAVAEGPVLPFEAVRPKILEAMEKAAWAEAARDFVNQLIAESDISGARLTPVGA
jgi:peptidyl-prolyl cis-trans isomerase C